MAVGDRITGARSTAIMRRINALEAQPRPTTTAYEMDPRASSNGLAIDSNGHIFLGGYKDDSIDELHVFDTTDLAPLRLSTEYPGSEGGWPLEHNLFDGDIYWQDYSNATPTSYKYSISGDSWSEMTFSDSEFDVPFGKSLIKNDGTDLFLVTSAHAIKRFNTSGVEQSTITFDDPSNLDTNDDWALSDFDFDDDGNIVLSLFLNDDSSGLTEAYIFRYDTSGSEISSSFGGSDFLSIGDTDSDGHDSGQTLSIIVNRETSNNGYFIAAYLNASIGVVDWDSRSYNKAGSELGTISSLDMETDDIRGASYYEDEIYFFESLGGFIRVYNSTGTLQRESDIFSHTQPSQTTFYRHPNRGTDTGKVSLGTPDKGVSVPSTTALDGFRPSAFEPSTMRSAMQIEATDRFQEYDSGTTTSTTANKLVQTGQNFTSTVEIGDIVKNTTDGTQASVTAIDSDTTLSLLSDIMESGDDYRIVGAYVTAATPLARNIFDIALGSQTDWTTSTITVGDKIKDEVYTEMETVLTELETASVE